MDESVIDIDESQQMEKLLDYLKLSRGFDFTAYKRTTLQRRIQKRMSLVGCATYEAYLDYLEVHPDEFSILFNTILINVTSFFRDQEAWNCLSKEVIPLILEGKCVAAPVRVWTAGCASGEEAYTIAMLLSEAVGQEAYRERVKIYATDVDEEALNMCRAATYSPRDVDAMPKEMVAKYIEPLGDRLTFDRELRRSMIFGRHDLIQDAPISRIDLLTCRNTLMYFNAEAQERILQRFHFALSDGGFLFLGKAETLLTHTNLFTPVDMKNRVFKKVPRGRIRDRSFFMQDTNGDGGRSGSDSLFKLRELASDAAPVAQIVLDLNGRLAGVNERARTLFGLSLRDFGRPFQDLEVSFRPVELRSGIEQAIGQRRIVVHKEVHWTTFGGDGLILDIRVSPVIGANSETVGTVLTFEDVTQFKHLQDELLSFNQELETAYEEVQSTNEELQTTNEELQSTVEELETTNEELQSTNEELETMNEELQSSNEELETINEELRLRGEELMLAKGFLESVLTGLKDGVIVVDRNLEILAWNSSSEDLWGLRVDEVVGLHLMNLDIGLPVEQLRAPIRACLQSNDYQATEIEATNRRGKQTKCSLRFAPLQGHRPEPQGVIILCEGLASLSPVA